MSGYPVSFVSYCFELYFLTKGLDPVYKWNFVEFLVNFRELKNFKMMSLNWVLDLCFSNGLWYHNVLWVLDWISRNCDPFKDTRRLPRVDLWVGAWQAFLEPSINFVLPDIILTLGSRNVKWEKYFLFLNIVCVIALLARHISVSFILDLTRWIFIFSKSWIFEFWKDETNMISQLERLENRADNIL